MKIFDILKFAVNDLLRLNVATETIMGTDHAHYDWETQDGKYYPIDYDLAYRNGSRFAILKVVNGSVIQNHAVDELRRAHASPLFAMPYMWPYPVQYIPAPLQAQKYHEVMQEFPGMTIALDAEETPYYPNPQGSDHEAVIREYWKLDPERMFLLYSNYYYITANGFNTTFFAQFPLWLSRPGIYEPVVPSAWTRLGKTWTLWQDNWQLPPSPYGVTNGKQYIDGNKFNGNISELAAVFGGAEIPPEPPAANQTISVKITRS